MPVLSAQERVGTLFAGRYRLESILGSGSTGVVYEASHAWSGRTVAVKLLKPHLVEDPSAVRRFMQEARSASEVLHAHVVQILDMGAEDDGTVFFAMERFEGESLEDHLAGEPLSVEETLRVLAPVMDALAYAHERGVVHRDLKPANVFLHRDGRGRVVPKLLDFGLSKLLDSSWGSATQTGTVIGTPYYMAPEQAEGASDQGAAIDVWAMGVVLYRCLSGRLPFEASSPPKLLVKILEERPAPLSEVSDAPAPIAEVVDRALIKDPGERYADMSELLAALRGACERAEIPFPTLKSDAPPPERERFDPGPRRDARRRWPIGAAAAAVAILGLAGLGWAWSASTPGEEPTAEPTPPAATSAPDTTSASDTAAAPGTASDPDPAPVPAPGPAPATAQSPAPAHAPAAGPATAQEPAAARASAPSAERPEGAIPDVTRRW